METQMATELLQGRVRNYNTERGYGWIEVTGRADVYFHITEYDGKVRQGAPVEFEMANSRKGPRAVNIRPIN